MMKHRTVLFVALAALMSATFILAVSGCPKTQEKADQTTAGPTPPAGPTAAKAAGSPDGKITIAMVPKLIGIDFFNACEKGAKEAAAELGPEVELIYDGPNESKVERQIEMINSFVDQGVDVVAVAANDPDAISGCLKRAADAGVIPITWDSDASPEASGRRFFINQATPESIGYALMDELARQAGEDASYAIISGTPTAANQNIWMEYMEKRRVEKYPKMTALTTEFPGEDQAAAMEAAQGLLKRYPDIKGILGITSVSFPGAVEAVVNAGKQKDVSVVGLATPNPMKEWIHNGDIKSVVLWNPVDLGYLTIYACVAAKKGELEKGATSFKAGRLGEVKVDGDQVILGDPLIFTKDNIDQYDF